MKLLTARITEAEVLLNGIEEIIPCPLIQGKDEVDRN